MRKAIIILAVSLFSFKKSYSVVEYTCVSYIQDTINHVYCVTYNDLSDCSPYAWHWDFGNGDTSNLPSPYSCFSYPGMYQVKLVATCSSGNQDSVTHTLYIDSANIFCFYTGPAGIEPYTMNGMTVFPNPVENILTVKSNAGEVAIEIFSSMGKLLHVQKLGWGETGINLDFLAHGIYFLRYSEANEVRRIKFVKQ